MSLSPQDPHLWALEEFGRARLGDARRTRRLVSLAARAAAHPAGPLTRLLSSSAERQGAYGLLESPHLAPAEIALASHRACLERCAGLDFVFVALDSSTIASVDHRHAKDFGWLGNDEHSSRGLHVLSALVVTHHSGRGAAGFVRPGLLDPG